MPHVPKGTSRNVRGSLDRVSKSNEISTERVEVEYHSWLLGYAVNVDVGGSNPSSTVNY